MEEEIKTLKMASRVHQLAIASEPNKSPSVYVNGLLRISGFDDGFSCIPIVDHGPTQFDVPSGEFDDEYHFNSVMFDCLSRIFGADTLFNSEWYGYLPASDDPKNDNKPDWLLCAYREFCTSRDKPNNRFARDDINYAVPSSEDCIPFLSGIIEGKMSIGPLTAKDVEPLFRYLKLLENAGHEKPRGIVYNRTEVLYAEYTTDGGITCVEKYNWTKLGDGTFLKHKFEPPRIVQALLLVLGEDPSLMLSSYLGGGRFGHVFKLKKEENFFALKIVMDYFQQFREEFQKLTDANKAAPDLVVHPVLGSLVVKLDACVKHAYYLMDEVGTAPEELLRRRVFHLLCQLHEKGLSHGDPRLENIISYNVCLKWIDMRNSMGNSHDSFLDSMLNDVVCVIGCCFSVPLETVRHTEIVVKWIREIYIPHISPGAMDTLYNNVSRVWE
jgi:hypothetical protein